MNFEKNWIRNENYFADFTLKLFNSRKCLFFGIKTGINAQKCYAGDIFKAFGLSNQFLTTTEKTMCFWWLEKINGKIHDLGILYEIQSKMFQICEIIWFSAISCSAKMLIWIKQNNNFLVFEYSFVFKDISSWVAVPWHQGSFFNAKI